MFSEKLNLNLKYNILQDIIKIDLLPEMCKI